MAKVVTEKMFSYATSLITKAVPDPTERLNLLLNLPKLNGDQVSKVIDMFKPLAYASTAPALPTYIPPAGSYLIGSTVYKVKISKKSGAPYLMSADGEYIGALSKVNGACETLASEATAYAAMTAHGKATGVCGVCGTTLTNPKSIEAGIGPICAGKYGY